MKKIFIIVIIFLLGTNAGYCDEVLNLPFKEASQPLDDKGQRINAHAGDIVYYSGMYYWYGEDETNRAAARTGVHVYESSNLKVWKDRGLALSVSTEPTSDIYAGSILERPKVLFNKKNNNFVMFFHLEKKGMGYSSALVGVAESSTPTGPFFYKHSFRLNPGKLPLDTTNLSDLPNAGNFKRDFNSGQMSRDMTVFKDDDSSAYLISSSEGNRTLIITKLNSNYDFPTNSFIRVAPGDYNEAPVVFKKDNKYYIISSGSSGWKPNKARLYESNSMLGRWVYVGTPVKSESLQDVNTTFGGQGAFIFKHKGKYIFSLDIWDSKNLKLSNYLFIVLCWTEDGKPYLSLSCEN